jgi:hypothetical protein
MQIFNKITELIKALFFAFKMNVHFKKLAKNVKIYLFL